MGLGVVSVARRRSFRRRLASDRESLLKCAGCYKHFYPQHGRQKYHNSECSRRARKKAARTRDRTPRARRLPGSTKTPRRLAFWFQTLDLVHYFKLALPELLAGVATIHRKDWIRLLARSIIGRRRSGLAVVGGEESPTALRSWERWKQVARAEGLLIDASPYYPTDSHHTLADAAAGFVHIDIARAYDGAFRHLGSPHPGGDEAEDAAITREVERLDALTDLADVLEAVQARRRAEGVDAASRTEGG